MRGRHRRRRNITTIVTAGLAVVIFDVGRIIGETLLK